MFVVYSQSKDITLTNITANPIHQNDFFVMSDPKGGNVENLTIEDSKIFYASDNLGPTIELSDVAGFTSRKNMMYNVTNINPVILTNVQVNEDCGNIIYYNNGTESAINSNCDE
jgi:hypothetical protein